MGPYTTVLCERLAQTIELLDSVNEVFWANWLRKGLGLIQDEDFAGIEQVYAAFGGMGSFNDVYVAAINGHRVLEKDRDTINRKLDNLRTELFELVQTIRHHAEISGP